MKTIGLLLAAILTGLVSIAFAEEPVVLRYVLMDNVESMPVVRSVVAEFEAKNPDIRIKIEPVSDEYVQKLLTQYAAGAAPDVVQLSMNHYQAFASRGALLSVTKLVDDHGGIELSRWYPNVRQFFTYQGQMWALPADVGPFGLIFYNKSLFDKANIKYPDPNWTWDYSPRPELKERDFVWVMQQLTKTGPNGKTEVFGFAPEWPQLWFYLLLESRGLRLWDDSAAPRRIVADRDEIVRLMEFANSAINIEHWIPSWDQIATVRQSSPKEEFLAGRIAMYMTFTSYADALRTGFAKTGVDWDVTLFPAFRGQERRLQADGSGTAIFSSTPHPEEAWRFAQYIAGEPGQTRFARAGLSQPAIRDLAQKPGVWLYDKSMPAQRKKPESLYLTDEAAVAMRIAQTPEYFEDTRNHLDSGAFDILSGTRPARETLKRVTAEAQLKLDSALRREAKTPFPLALGIGAALLVAGGGVAWIFWPERRIRLTQAQKQESRSAYVFLIPCLLGLVIFTIGPMLYSLMLSFAQSDMIRPPQWRGVGNYVDAFTLDPIFLISIKVTGLYTLVSVPLSVAFALGLALLMNVRVRGIPLFRAIYYIPSLASGVATSLIWMRIFNPENGLLNRLIYGSTGQGDLFGIGSSLSELAGTPGEPVNWLASEHTVLPAFIVMGLWGVGGGAVIFLAGLQGIAKSYYEAAYIDGAGPWRQFRHVTAPLLTPTIFFSFVTGIIGSFQVFTQSFVMTGGGPNNATQFYMLNLYTQAFRSLKMGYASALAWILFAIVLAFTLAQLKAAKRWVHYEGGEA